MRKMVPILVSLFLLTFPGCEWGKQSKSIVLQPQKCGIATLRFYDENRHRPLLTEVWYPVEEQVPAEPVNGVWVRCPEARDAPISSSLKKYPLVVMSHGNGGDRMNSAWLAEILAANGYIVAAMDHHGNTWNNQIAELFLKIWERPKDVSFVIDQLLQNSNFASYINAEKIGFVGYSLGGHTGVWLAGGRVDYFDKSLLNTLPPDQLPSSATPELIDTVDFFTI
jgi:predicted dienelactone hydrolase